MQQVDQRCLRTTEYYDITGRNKIRSNKWYYLAFEGETEFNYFGIIRDYKEELGIKDNVGCIRLHRFDDEKDETDPKWIKDQVDQFKNGLCGKYTPRLFLKQALMKFKDSAMKDLSPKYRNEEYVQKCTNLDSKLHDIEEELLEIISDEEYCTEGYISDTSETFNLIKKSLKKSFPEFKSIIMFMNNPANSALSPEDLLYDRFCVIVDRDYYSDSYRINKEIGEQTSEYYDNLIDYFENSNVSLYVTNPQFEFWLILHFDKIRFDEDKMLKNIKIKNSKRYAEETISEYIPGYSKYSLDKKLFIGSDKKCKPILRAIKRIEENGYETNLKELKNHLGSNIGLLINEMKNG